MVLPKSDKCSGNALCVVPDVSASILFHFFFLSAFCHAANDWYVSKALGTKTSKCNSPQHSCKYLADVFPLVVWGDKIHLDGTNTEQHPYACTSMTSQYPGTRLNLNRSLSLIGRNGPAHLFCLGGIFFVGRNTEVSLRDLTFYSTPMSFYNGKATIQNSVFTNISEAGIEASWADTSDGILQFHSMANLTIMKSVFKRNARIWVNGGYFVSLTKSRLHNNPAGMAASIYPSAQATIMVDNCAFLNNWGGLKISQIKNTSLFLTNTLFSQNFHTCSLVLEFDSSSAAVIENITIEKNTIWDSNQRKVSAAYISLYAGGHNKVEIHNSTFKQNTNLKSGVGAIIVDNDPDVMMSKGCKSDLFNTSIDAYSVYRYINQIVFRNSVFERNSGQFTGAIVLFNGLTTFQNCTFVDNVGFFGACHLAITAGSGAAEIYNCTFLQAKMPPRDREKNPTFLYSSSSGPLTIKDTHMDFIPLSDRDPILVEIVDGGNVNIENSSSMVCPVGSKLWLDNYSHQIVTTSELVSRRCALDIKVYCIYCDRCPRGFYSLQRGHANGTRVREDFKCLPCPFGGNCSDNIVNLNHFWGSVVKQNPPTLQFFDCPLDYCETPEDPASSIFNGCHGNRSGVLCGACAEGYSETLFSTSCRRNEDCNDVWLWPAVIIYSLVVAIFFVTKPPVVPFLLEHILWFRKPTSEEEKSNEKSPEDTQKDNGNTTSGDSGYLDVIFYFYQVVGLLIISTTGQTIQAHFFVPLMTSIFNFRFHSSSSGLGCPFPGLTVVTKELFAISEVFSVVFCVFLIYGARQIWAKLRNSPHPSLAPHLAAATEVVLLGYTSLATSAFKLLTLKRVRPGKEFHLYFDGNIEFITWWQYILLGCVIIYVIPFVGLLFWGASWLNERRITAREFLIACVVPLPFLLYWALRRNKRACRYSERLQQTEERVAIMQVLYGPFRAPDAEQKGTLYWESILIGRRLILIVLFAFINNASLRLLLSTMACVLIAIHHILWNPYKIDTVNRLETVSLVVIIMFGLFNTVHATFITAGVRFWGPIKTYVDALGWIQLCLLLLLPLALIIAVIFAVLSQVVRAGFVVGLILHRHFSQTSRRKSSSVISRKKSFRDTNKDSLFSDAELITDACEMANTTLSREDGIFHDNIAADEEEIQQS